MTAPRFRRLLVAALCATMLAPLAPASAGVSSPTPPPGSSGGNATSSSGSTQCVDGAGRYGGEFVYHAPYSRCDGSAWNVNYGLETTWFEVWRFYGTEARPAQSWSVSRLMIADWDGSAQNSVVFAPHPDDAGNAPSGSVWRRSTDRVTNGDYGGTVRLFTADGSSMSPGAAVRSGANNAYTTDRPFRSSGSCRSAQTDQTAVAAIHDRSSDTYAEAEPFRELTWDIYSSARGAYGPDAALTVINARPPYPSGPDDITYGDGVDCSSVMDFAVTGGQEARTFTQCWVPVEMRYINKRRASGDYYKDYTVRGGPRYHTATLPDRFPDDEFDDVRRAIHDEVRSRPVDQATPAQSYGDFTSSSHPARDADAAAREARDHASCVQGRGAVMETDVATSTPPATARVDITVAGPSDFVHVGGQFAPATWTAVASGLRCGANACPSGTYRLRQLGFELRVVGTNGYTRCSSPLQISCDFTWADTGTSARNGRTSSQEATGQFYRATDRSQRVRADVYRVSGVYQRRVEKTVRMTCTGAWVHVDEHGGREITDDRCGAVTSVEWVDTPLTVRVVSEPTVKVTAGVGR